MTDPLDELSATVVALVEHDAHALPDTSLLVSAESILTVINRLEGVLTARLQVMHVRDVTTAECGRKTRSWLIEDQHLGAEAASKLMTVVKALPTHPVIAAARWVDPTALGHFARELRSRLDPAETAEAAEQRKDDDRWLTLTPTFQGMHRLDGMLDPASAAAVLTALGALSGKAGEIDERSVGQRRADALVTLALQALNTGTLPAVGGDKPHLIATIPYDQLTAKLHAAGEGQATLNGLPISPATARMLACDAGIIPAILGSHSEVLDLGRKTPLWSLPQRRALQLEDTGCRFPHCQVGLGLYHHRLIHHTNWRIHKTRNNQIRVWRTYTRCVNRHRRPTGSIHTNRRSLLLERPAGDVGSRRRRPRQTCRDRAGARSGAGGVQTFATRLDPKANSLNAIRLVLAATVIVSHSWPLGHFGRPPTHGGFAPGGWAVDAFFVLSGYLITGSRLNNDLVPYLKRRVLRIYPGFLVCLLSVVLVFAPIGYFHLHHTLRGYLSTPSSPVDYVLSNLGLKIRVPGVAGVPSAHGAIAGTLWTLYFEFLCYLIVGLLACWVAFRTRPIVAIVVLTAATALSLQNNHVGHHTDMANLVRLLPFFMAGAVCYLLRDRIPCTWWLALLSFVALVFVPDLGTRFVVLCALPLSYLMLYLGAVVPVAIGRRNDISYGIYMYGFAVEEVVYYFHVGPQLLFIAVSILATVPIAAASWWFVERPAMRWRRAKASPTLATTAETKAVLVSEAA